MQKFAHCILFVLIGIVVITACKHATEPQVQVFDYSAITTISYSAHVQKLLNDNCTACHNKVAPAAGLSLASWDDVIKGSSNGGAIIPFDSKNSLAIKMLTKLVGGPHPFEQGVDTLGTVEVNFLARWIDEGAKNDAGEAPYENSTDRLYVANQNQAMVSIIDTKANVVIRNVNLEAMGHSPASKPHHIAVEPDGSGWYLSLIGDNRVLKFNAQNEVVAEAQINIPALLAVHPSEDFLYVSRFMDLVNPLTSIFILNKSTMQPAPMTENGEVPVRFKIPHAMAVDHTGKFIYSASLAESQLIVIDNASKETVDFIPLGVSKGPLQIAVSPDDREAYVSCQLSEQIFVIDISNPAAREVVDSVSVGVNPWHPAFTLDGSRVYVGNFGSNSVSVINTTTRTVEHTITGNGLAQPHGIAVSKNGFIYISCRNVNRSYTPRYDFGDNGDDGTVVVIDPATNQIVKVLEIGKFGSGMGIWEQ